MTQGSRRGSVVVTGAASGIGAAVTSDLVEAGYGVIAWDLSELQIPKDTSTRQVQAVRCDVSDAISVEEAAAQLHTETGSIVGLVNAAGVSRQSGDVTETDSATWDRTIAVNLTGTFLVSRAIIPFLRDSGGGSIVHVASQLGLVGTSGNPSYSASKGGVIALARSMALDHADDSIRVNAVCPGPIDTPMFQASSGPSNMQTLTETMIPWGRIGKPEEVAALITFLVSERSKFITGSAIPIDGGWTAR